MKRRFKVTQIDNLKEMINKSADLYGNRVAYKIKKDNEYTEIKYTDVLEMVNSLGTSLINMGLKNKRIAIIGENRYEWEIAYLSVVCGTGVVVPFDKALPEGEIESLIERSGVEAIFFSKKYEDVIKNIKLKGIGNLKYLISMDLEKNTDEILSEKGLIEDGKKLIENGNKKFIDSKIDNNIMSIMLFTSGTTSKSKIVALSNKNICSDIMDIMSCLDISKEDIFLSLLPLHHVFESSIGFLMPLYIGAQIVFCDGLRHIVENLNEYHVTIMSAVPAIYEQIYKNMMKQFEKAGILKSLELQMEENKNKSFDEKKKIFNVIYNSLGGHLNYLFCGAASMDPEIEDGYRKLGLELIEGYGLTETSPVIAMENEIVFKLGSVGKLLPSIKAKLINIDKDGMGELVVKGPNVMLGYLDNEEETKKVLNDGWFNTGDLAKIDDEGYIFICGRKKSVIVLKNGKNIFPEEMESILNKINGVKESFIFGKQNSSEKDDIKINAKLVYDMKTIKEIYNIDKEEEIYNIMKEKIKEINKEMPSYKAIKEISLTQTPLIRTTTAKIKRQEEMLNI